MGFGFSEPMALVLLLLVPAAYYFYRMHLKKKRENAIKFSNLAALRGAAKERKGPLIPREHAVFYILLLSLGLMSIGFSDPHIPWRGEKEGVNVVLVLDVSGSMQAQDYKPSRIEAAKSSAETLIDSLGPKDNVGIVIFESGATTAAYMTPFKDRAKEKLRAIAPKQGRTAIGDGLSLAVDMATSIPNKKRVVILLSDGVNNAGVVSPEEAIEFARQNKIQVNTIGLGTATPAVLGYDMFGNPQYAELDENMLRQIAEKTGGVYYKSVDEDTLKDIYSKIGSDINREWVDTSIKDWFFAGAMLSLIAAMYVSYGKYRIIS